MPDETTDRYRRAADRAMRERWGGEPNPAAARLLAAEPSFRRTVDAVWPLAEAAGREAAAQAIEALHRKSGEDCGYCGLRWPCATLKIARGGNREV